MCKGTRKLKRDCHKDPLKNSWSGYCDAGTLEYQGTLFNKNNTLPVMFLVFLSARQFLFLLFLQQVGIFPFKTKSVFQDLDRTNAFTKESYQEEYYENSTTLL